MVKLLFFTSGRKQWFICLQKKAPSWRSESLRDSGAAASLKHFIPISFQGNKTLFQYWMSLSAPLKHLTAGNWKPRYFQAQATLASLSCRQPLSASFRAYHERHQGFREALSLGSALQAHLADYSLEDTLGQLAGHAGQARRP